MEDWIGEGRTDSNEVSRPCAESLAEVLASELLQDGCKVKVLSNGLPGGPSAPPLVVDSVGVDRPGEL